MEHRRLLVTGSSGFIGANFIETVERHGGYGILGIDAAQPTFGSKASKFVQCDILDLEKLKQTFAEFQPTHVVHFAARTDMFGATVDDYAANHVGTANIVTAIQQTPSVKKVVFTSSQYVCGPGRLPVGDEDYFPHTIYGESEPEIDIGPVAALLGRGEDGPTARSFDRQLPFPSRKHGHPQVRRSQRGQ